jgi:hypothetical protein
VILWGQSGQGLHIVVQQLDTAWKAVYYVDTRSGAPTIVEIRIIPINNRFETIDRGDDVDVVSNLTDHTPVGILKRPLAARSLQRRLRPGRAISIFRTVPGHLSDAVLARVGLTAVVRKHVRLNPSRSASGHCGGVPADS